MLPLLTIILLLPASQATPASPLPTSEDLTTSLFMDFIIPSLALIFTLMVFYFIYTFVIKPYQAINFYRKQGIPMHYSPVIGSYSQDLDNAREKGDYYYDWVQISKQEPRPKAMGKNVAQDPQLYLIDPEAIKHFFNNNHIYIKHPFLNALTKELGRDGLVMAEGRVWAAHRKLMASGFQFDMLKNVLPEVLQHSLDMVGKYQHANLNHFNIIDELRDTAGEVIGRIFFEESLGGYKMQGEPMTLFLAHLIARMASEPYNSLYLMFGLPLVKTKLIPRQRKLVNDIREFREWCRGIVKRNMEKRREDNKNGLYPYKTRPNMFDLFYNHELANPTEAFTEDELVDEYITFFSDGVYTTGHFISMMTYYLEKNPEWKQKVQEEMDTLFPTLEDITYDNVQKMDTLAACMKETFRLAPPVVTAVERIALTDHELAGIQIKKGTIMMACHTANHLDERFFEDAETYNPDRWLKPSKSQESVANNPSLFIPFSMGPRRCIGQNFAMNEARVILTIFMKKYNYELADKDYQLRFTQRFLREPLDPIIYKLTPKQTNF